MNNQKETCIEEHLALFEESLPVNPIPFLNKAIELIKKNGTDYIQSDEVKALLWIIQAQSYGQLATINLIEEWERLKEIFNP